MIISPKDHLWPIYLRPALNSGEFVVGTTNKKKKQLVHITNLTMNHIELACVLRAA